MRRLLGPGEGDDGGREAPRAGFVPASAGVTTEVAIACRDESITERLLSSTIGCTEHAVGRL
jgi:hypothetical protein